MLSLFDTPSLERALALPLDPKLRRLLGEQVTHINALDNALDLDVRETSYFLIVPAGCAANDIADELGFSPLIDLDGRLFGEEGFTPMHDFLADRGGWFELLVSAGNEAVFALLVEDVEGADPDLLQLCRTYAD